MITYSVWLDRRAAKSLLGSLPPKIEGKQVSEGATSGSVASGYIPY
jgi:hypothetical protein